MDDDDDDDDVDVVVDISFFSVKVSSDECELARD
jgi:hypothetical protein